MTVLDASNYAGLSAMVLLTANILLGLMLSTRYSPPRRVWPYPRRRIFDIHNWTAYIALTLAFVHPILLLFTPAEHFRVIDLIAPLKSPGQTLYNCLGAIALYSIVVVVITSYFRKQLGFASWKLIHYSSYIAAAVSFVHGIIIDPNLKKLPPDLLDGEKLLAEGCCLLVLTASAWRLKTAVKRSKVAFAPDRLW